MLLLGAAAAMALTACSSRSTSSSGTQDFKGKTITIVAPFSSGGAVDVLAHLVAQDYSSFIPGHPTVIVKNMDGGGGSVGLRYVAEQEKADGLTMAILNTGIAIRYLTKQPGFNDLPDLPVIGGFPQGLVEAISDDAGTDLAKLAARTSPIRVAETAAGGDGTIAATVGHGLLGIPLKLVYGYSSGGGDAAAAILKGEVDAATTADASYDQTFASYVASNKMKPLFQVGVSSPKGIVRSPLAPSVPTILELYKQMHNGANPTGSLWDVYQLQTKLDTAKTVLAIRKGTPSATQTVLENAFSKMIASDQWKQDTKKHLSVSLPGEGAQETSKTWTAVLATSEADADQLSKASGLQ